MTIFLYIELGITIAAIVSMLTTLLHSKTPLTGPMVAQLVQPGITAFKAAFPKVNVPPELVTDVSQSFADAWNRYVLGITPPTTA